MVFVSLTYLIEGTLPSRSIHVATMTRYPSFFKAEYYWSCWEDPLEKGMATHCSVFAWRVPMDRGGWRAIVHGVARSRTRLSN